MTRTVQLTLGVTLVLMFAFSTETMAQKRIAPTEPPSDPTTTIPVVPINQIPFKSLEMKRCLADYLAESQSMAQYSDQLTDLYCSELYDVRELAGIEYLKNLTWFGIHTPNDAVNLSLDPLKSLFKLSGLSLLGSRIRTLQSLAGMSSLTGIFLTETSVSDLTPIGALSKLHDFQVADNASLSSLAPLRNAPSLFFLGVEPRDEYLSAISMLPRVRQLGVFRSANRATGNLALAFSAAQVEYLNVSIDFSNLDGIQAMTNLRSLDLQGFMGNDLSPLAGLAKLEALNLSQAYQVTNIGPLQQLSQLKYLNIGTTHVTNLSPLAGLLNLEYLDASTLYGLTDLSPLSGLVKLKTLLLSDVGLIVNISALGSLTQLQTLDLSVNSITDISALMPLQSFQYLNLLGNDGIPCAQLDEFEAQHPNAGFYRPYGCVSQVSNNSSSSPAKGGKK